MIFQVKKLSALVLSFVLCFNLCASVFAAETELPEENEPLILQGAAICASVVQATTATAHFVVDTALNAGPLFCQLLDEWCTFDDHILALYGSGRRFAQAVAEASTISEVGDIIVQSVMSGKIYRFIDWLRTEKGLIPGGSKVDFGDVNNGYIVAGGYTIPALPDVDTSKYPYLYAYKTPFSASSGNAEFRFYASSKPVYWHSESDFYLGYYNFWVLDMYTARAWYECNSGATSWTKGGEGADRGRDMGLGIPIYANTAIYEYDNQDVLWSGAIPSTPSYVPSTEYSLTPNESFQDLPSTIPDNQGLNINTGIPSLNGDDPQSVADAIFQAIIDGYYLPVVSVGDVSSSDPLISVTAFNVTSTIFTASVVLSGLDPTHEYKPFWSLYEKSDLTTVIASGYAADIGTVTGVNNYSGYSRITNLTPATDYFVNWVLLDVTEGLLVPSVSDVEFTTSAGASSDNSPSILLMILNKVSEILDKMNGGQSEGILASINEKLDDLIDTVANQYERELEDNFKDSLSGVNENFFSDTGKGQGVTVSDVVDLADTQGVFKDIFSGDYGFSDFLDLFSDDGFFPWFSTDTAMNLNPTAYGSPSAADLDDPYNMQLYYDNMEKVRNKSDD